MPDNTLAQQIEASINGWQSSCSDLVGGRDVTRWQGWARQRWLPALLAQMPGTPAEVLDAHVVASWPCLLHQTTSPERPPAPALPLPGQPSAAKPDVTSTAIGNWRGALMVLTERQLLISGEGAGGAGQVEMADRNALLALSPFRFTPAWGQDGPASSGYRLQIRTADGGERWVLFQSVITPKEADLGSLLERAGIAVSDDATGLPLAVTAASTTDVAASTMESSSTPAVSSGLGKQCATCGKWTRLEAKFCGGCGNAFPRTVPQPEVVAAPTRTPPTPTLEMSEPNLTAVLDFSAPPAGGTARSTVAEAPAPLPPAAATASSSVPEPPPIPNLAERTVSAPAPTAAATVARPAQGRLDATLLTPPASSQPASATTAGQARTPPPPPLAAAATPAPPWASAPAVPPPPPPPATSWNMANGRAGQAPTAQRKGRLITLIVVLSVLMFTIGGATVYFVSQGALGLQTPASRATPGQTVAAEPTTAADTTPTPTPPSTPAAPVRTPTPTPTLDPRDQALKELAAARQETIEGLELDGRWILQVDSKYEGVTDPLQTSEDGSHTFMLPDIWARHEHLASELGGEGDVLLLKGTDFGRQVALPGPTWVTVVDPYDPVATYDDGLVRCSELYPDLAGDELANACLPRQLSQPFSG